MSRAVAPLLAAVIGLAGALAATLFLYRAGEAALDSVLDERLRGGGESAALSLGGSPATADRLHALQKANDLDAASLVDRSVMVIADGSKLGGVARASVASIGAGQTLVTDESAKPAELDRLRDLGVRVVVAGAEGA